MRQPRLSLKRALEIAKEREGYERCRNPSHGFGKPCTYGGKTAPARFVICPIVQLYPKPTFLFHTWHDFVKPSEKVYRERGWL